MRWRMQKEVEEEFGRASKYVESIASRLDNEKLLYLYARYKQAKEGPCSIPKPGMFDFQGKKKWEAWRKLELMSRSQAMHEYVAWLNKEQPNWTKYKPRGSAGLGISVSTMAQTEEQLNDHDKTVFDWCREGNLREIQNLISARHLDVNGLDENGLALLHWACDRGHQNVVELLLSLDAKINVRDADGQTPLHFAVSCEHAEIAKLLISHGADLHAVDNDGIRVIDVSDSSDLKSLLQCTDANT